MNDTPPPARRGRPAKPAEECKGTAATFRARPSLRAKLEASAEAEGRSFSEEVETRLNRSFEREQVENILASPFASEVLREAAIMLGLLERTSQVSLQSHPGARKRAAELFRVILDSHGNQAAKLDWVSACDIHESPQTGAERPAPQGLSLQAQRV